MSSRYGQNHRKRKFRNDIADHGACEDDGKWKKFKFESNDKKKDGKQLQSQRNLNLQSQFGDAWFNRHVRKKGRHEGRPRDFNKKSFATGNKPYECHQSKRQLIKNRYESTPNVFEEGQNMNRKRSYERTGVNYQTASASSGHRRNRLGIGYKRLEQWSGVECPDDLLLNILASKIDFEQLLQRKDLKNDWIHLIIKISAKICHCIPSENKNEIFNLLNHSEFMKNSLNERIIIWASSSDTDKCIFKDVVLLFRTLIRTFPRSCLKLPLNTLKDVLTDKENLKEYESQVIELLQERTAFIESDCFIAQGTELNKDKKKMNVEDDIRQFNVIPITIGDILSHKTKLEKIKKFGGYENNEGYLKVQLNLLREDFISPLRNSIKEFTSQFPTKNKKEKLKIYKNIKLIEPTCTRNGITYLIHFELENLKQIPWKHSKKLLFGNLLCFSRDVFESCVFATVAGRDPENLAKGFLRIKINDHRDVVYFNTKEKIIMVESPSYLEAYRYVLEAMKRIKPMEIPMKDYIVKCETNVQSPIYTKNCKDDMHYNLTESLGMKSEWIFNIFDENSWPSFEQTELNESQLNAFKHALTKEFSLIQGPPGTGKTHVGIRIANALIENKSYWDAAKFNKERPMLIVCYTNHALDQFLEGLTKFWNCDIVRVGGRCSPAMIKYSLREKKFRESMTEKYNLHNKFRKIGRAMSNPYSDRRDLSEDIELKIRLIENMKDKSIKKAKTFTFQELQKYMLFKHRETFLNMMENIDKWETNIMDVFLENKNLIPLNRKSFDSPKKEFILDGAYTGSYINVEGDAEMLSNNYNLDEDLYELMEKVQVNKQVANSRMFSENFAEFKLLRREAVDDIENPWELNVKYKYRLYEHWVTLYLQETEQMLPRKLELFENACKKIQELEDAKDIAILEKCQIIGMTTTAAAKYASKLNVIKPAVVIVEEAAEVLEAHVLTALSPKIEHLILIGDHKQLQPKPSVYKLACHFGLNISLFQRMVDNGLECHSLNIQHRMRPEISYILRHIYPSLKDHHSVTDYPNIKGITKNVFFVDHDFKEYEMSHIKSKANAHEALFIKELCAYLLKQGYKSSQITIISSYTGQIIEFKNIIDKKSFEGIRITSIDNFQGEENDIILLSLVRNNVERETGFLKIENRICVALSRAKQGLYVFGNFQILCENSPLWAKIILDAKEKEIFGKELTLQCEMHRDRSINVSKADDFKQVPEGGCMLPCNFRLECGHVCISTCHPRDQQHKQIKCLKKCKKKTCEGDSNHRCEKKCHFGISCGPCQRKVTVQLPKCNHQQAAKCCDDINSVLCVSQCEKVRQCGHYCKSKCGYSCEDSECEVLVRKTLLCGHVGLVQCSKPIETFRCEQPCQHILKCQHHCSGKCYTCKQGRLHKKCFQKCERILPCSHICKDSCSYCPPCVEKCENRCEHSQCENKCGETCVQCMEECLSKCKHSKCKNLCYEMCDRRPCEKPCEKFIRKCRHRCIGLCGEVCPKLCRICDKEKVEEIFFGTEDNPQSRFIQLEDCDHFFEKESLDTWMKTKQENNEIQLKKCPKCNTVIRKSRRYGNAIKSTLNDIEQIKLIDIKTDALKVLKEEAFIKCKEYTQKLVSTHIKEKNTLFTRGVLVSAFTSFTDFLKSDLKKERNDSISLQLAIQLKTANEKDTNRIINQFQVLTKLLAIKVAISDNDNLPSKSLLKKDIDDLEIYVVRKINEEQMEYAFQEVNRIRTQLNLLIMLFQVANDNRFEGTSDEKEMVQTIQTFKSGKLIPQNELEIMNEFLKSIEQKYGFKISSEEKQMVIKAMDFRKKGHWYKCSKGHIYCIGECGGAMQKSKCPECGETIGGTNHQLVQSSLLAGEFDGAPHAAWSNEANNLMNLDPLQLAELQR